MVVMSYAVHSYKHICLLPLTISCIDCLVYEAVQVCVMLHVMLKLKLRFIWLLAHKSFHWFLNDNLYHLLFLTSSVFNNYFNCTIHLPQH